MLLEKLQEHKNFTAHEKDVAEYILSHLDQISELSAGELAKASYTSKATVVRLSQKLGLNGFQDLKITLTAEINQKKRIDQLLANEPVTAESTYDDIVKTLPALYDKAVTNTRLSLDKNSMKRISQVLQKQSASIFTEQGSVIYLHSRRRLKSVRSGWNARHTKVLILTIWRRVSTRKTLLFDQSDRIKSYGDLYGKIFKGGDRNLCGRNCRSLSYRT